MDFRWDTTQVSVLTYPGYRGPKGGGQNYTQLNYQVMVSTVAPAFFITNSQTQLLLAEAKFKGWITGGLTAKQYYEAGVKAAMDEWALFPGIFSPAVIRRRKKQLSCFTLQLLIMMQTHLSLSIHNTGLNL